MKLLTRGECGLVQTGNPHQTLRLQNGQKFAGCVNEGMLLEEAEGARYRLARTIRHVGKIVVRKDERERETAFIRGSTRQKHTRYPSLDSIAYL